jgi:hypothetical protein
VRPGVMGDEPRLPNPVSPAAESGDAGTSDSEIERKDV